LVYMMSVQSSNVQIRNSASMAAWRVPKLYLEGGGGE